MTQTKNYPTTPQVNLPQPHVTIPERTDNCRCSGWLPFVSVGICAIIFLTYVCLYGGATKLFPVSVNLYAGLVPIEKKGFLEVIPFVEESNNSIRDSHVVNLPLEIGELAKYTQVFDELLKGYPEKHEKPYRSCWLENPSIDHPCYYDRSWITEICTRNNSYGYNIFRGEYSPCFILQFKDTKDWKPIHPYYNSFMSEHFDHGFVPVICNAQDNSQPSTSIEVHVYPPKGYSLLYFPESKFGRLYLPPLVAVKVNGIRRSRNVTVNCEIATPNAFVLKNNGRISVTFSSS